MPAYPCLLCSLHQITVLLMFEQIETDKGTRELRMRCKSPEAVTEIIEDMRVTVMVRNAKSVITH